MAMGDSGKPGPVGRCQGEPLIGDARCRFCRTDKELERARQSADVACACINCRTHARPQLPNAPRDRCTQRTNPGSSWPSPARDERSRRDPRVHGTHAPWLNRRADARPSCGLPVARRFLQGRAEGGAERRPPVPRGAPVAEEIGRVRRKIRGQRADCVAPVQSSQQRTQRRAPWSERGDRVFTRSRHGRGIEDQLRQRVLISDELLRRRAGRASPAAPGPDVAVAGLARGELDTKLVSFVDGDRAAKWNEELPVG